MGVTYRAWDGEFETLNLRVIWWLLYGPCSNPASCQRHAAKLSVVW